MLAARLFKSSLVFLLSKCYHAAKGVEGVRKGGCFPACEARRFRQEEASEEA